MKLLAILILAITSMTTQQKQDKPYVCYIYENIGNGQYDSIPSDTLYINPCD